MTPRIDSAWLPDDKVLFAQLVGYALSVALALLLATLVWRYTGEGRRARLLFVACCVAWALGGLTKFVLQAAGLPEQSLVVTLVQCATFSAASIWPLALPLLWERHTSLSKREASIAKWLVRASIVTAVVLIAGFALMVMGVDLGIERDTLPILVAYNAAAILTVGAVVVFRHLETRLERVAVTMMALGPVLTIVGHNVHESGVVSAQWDAGFQVLMKQSILLTIVGGLFYLGRFRGLDRFAKLALQAAHVSVLAVFTACLVFGPVAEFSRQSASPDVMWLAGSATVIAAALCLFAKLGQVSDHWVDRWVFGRVDPEVALASFRERLAREETVTSVISAAESFLRETLRVEARLLPRSVITVAPAKVARAGAFACSGDHCRDRATLGALPVYVGDTEPLALELDSPDRRMLVTAEVDLARQAAQWVGGRLEALERERERMERSRREASLVHQLVEAELRALRAQINPHFLFNSLNTIAALVHEQPNVAEQMTVRLARIFRHVLKQTERPFSSLQEEMDFLRAYLDIEQIRFGERLKIDFRVAESVADSQVPSLILQPLVENAIKHGLSPKLGECRLVISGTRDREHVLLSVEDNGVGTVNVNAVASAGTASGIGLRNVRERLRTLYGERASLSFESNARLGSRAAVYLPVAAA